MADKVLTGPMALVKVKGYDGTMVTIGKLRNVRVTENFTRGRVVGIGEITPSELPLLAWNGTVTAGQYGFKITTGIMNAIDRSMTDIATFVNTILFETGVDIWVYMRQTTVSSTSTTFGQTDFAKILGCLLTSEGFDINEGQISGRDATFEYKNPILYG